MKTKKQIIIKLTNDEQKQIEQVQDILCDIWDIFKEYNIKDDYKLENIVVDLGTICEDFQHYLISESEE